MDLPGFLLPDPGDGEVVQLDVLDDLVQQPVRHGVEVRERVRLEGGRGDGLGPRRGPAPPPWHVLGVRLA